MEVLSRQKLDMDIAVDSTLRDFFEDICNPNKTSTENIKMLKETMRNEGVFIVTKEQIRNVFSKAILGLSMMKIDDFDKALLQSEKIQVFIYEELGVR